MYTDETLMVKSADYSADITDKQKAAVYKEVRTIRDCLIELGLELSVSKTNILLFHDVQARLSRSRPQSPIRPHKGTVFTVLDRSGLPR